MQIPKPVNSSVRAALIYAAIMSLAGLLLMLSDKRRAKQGRRRIPERTLFIVAALGGSLGAWAGMYGFRHKTKHWYFVVFMPVLVMIHAFLLFVLIRNAA